MKKRDYYSIRTGKILPGQEMSLEVLKKLFSAIYYKMEKDGYFQKYFGYDCTDGFITGELGNDIESIILINLRKDLLYPVHKFIDSYSEDDFFDILEFMHDYCSKGISGRYHSRNDCGYHYDEFSDEEGQKYFRGQINPLLKEYGEGFELSDLGEILILSDNGLSNLFNADIPSQDKDNVVGRIDAAILKFRRHKSTLDDRKEAIRELADVLEFLRPDIEKLLDKKDENDLFNIANNFGIRHHNIKQKKDYDKAIWYSWIFYYYLATLHAVLRMKNKK